MTTMTHEELESRMLDLLEDICGDDAVRDHRDEDLFELGLLDSMAAVELLVSIEDEFGVSIAPTEVPRNEMNTVNLIIEQVEKRMA
ncbi:MAG: D-alanine--poly(phosphoribitol) ligase subunit DltC [Coriobacteriales bacterium]|jgi:D-alanine--poly(phosphoribitol) ligase subunit 2